MRERASLSAKKQATKGETPAPASRGDALPGGLRPTHEQVLSFQRTLGNQDVQRLLQSGRIQAKLKIGRPNDAYEREADSVAGQVMRMPEPAVRKKSACGGGAACAGEPVKRRLVDQTSPKFTSKDASRSGEAPASVQSSIETMSGSGDPLPASARSYFEPRFGKDFGNVRVHTDAGPAEASRAIQARAFTSGEHIAFAEGEYSPETARGRELLAHELTHVVQQSGSDRNPLYQSGSAASSSPVIQRIQTATQRVQRAPFDFRVRGIAPEDAANPDTIFFEQGSASLVAGERAKIAALAVPAGRNLTLKGFSSEEGSDSFNDALIRARLNAVAAALATAGHNGARTRVNRRANGVGQIDYRRMRAVEVLPTRDDLAVAPSAQDDCEAPGAVNAPCGNAFERAFPAALTAMLISWIRLANPADAGANGLVSRLFPGVPRATINANMNALFRQVVALPAHHRCHSSCDPDCSRPAYQSGTGVGAGGAILTLCPGFQSRTNVMDNAQTLVHESAHGTTGQPIDDIAYRDTRQITFLTPADAVRNTDSYVLLAFELAFPGIMTIGSATPDTLVGMTAAEENSARRAVAWVESWLNYGEFDTEILYGTINRSMPPAPAWDTSKDGDTYNRKTMHLIAPVFGLTDPGIAAPFVQPTKTDKINVAAIRDRYQQMYRAVNFQTLNVSKGAVGSGAWQSRGASLPRLGRNVTLAPAFFAMSAVDQVKDLVLLMATAMSGISSGFRHKYVDAMDLIRIHRNLGP